MVSSFIGVVPRRLFLSETTPFSAYPRFFSFTPSSVLLTKIQEFQASGSYEVLLFIGSNSDSLSVSQARSLVEALNERIAEMNLVAFGGHPLDDFNIQGVYTRREPFINIAVQSLDLLNAASRHLQKTNYYQNWSEENLKQIDFQHRG
jgi:hypothetical protein